jgi:phospholipase C
MPFTLEHTLVSRRLDLEQTDTLQGFFFTVAAAGSFLVLHPGRLQRTAQASVRHSMRIDIPDTGPPTPPHGIDDPTGGGLGPRPPNPTPGPHPLHNGVVVTEEGLTLDLRILTPDGALFTRDEVTLGDLRTFRSLRGTPRPWSFTLSGTSRTYQPVAAINETITDPKGILDLGLTETVPSLSAAPLVPRTRLGFGPTTFTFDLNRVGDFVANVVGPTFDTGSWRGSMRLLDPDGAEFARSVSRNLRCPIPLSVLGRSRAADGTVRLWSLEVIQQADASLSPHFITATVLGPGRITTSVLQSRIQRIFGADGTFLQFSGANSGGQAQAILTITDVAAAETIDMHGLLDSRLKVAGRATDVNADTPLVVFRRDSELGYGVHVDISDFATTSIVVAVGPAKHLGPGTPAVRVVVSFTGAVKFIGKGLTLATAAMKGGTLELEVGLNIDPDGTPRVVSWVPDEPFDIRYSDGAIEAWIAAFAAGGGLFGGVVGAFVGVTVGALTIVAVQEVIATYMENGFHDGVAKLFDDPALAPRILMTLLGAHMTYLPTRFEGDDMLFEHVAPLEPDPKPRPSYAGAIGRAALENAVGLTRFMPASLGDTWAAENLISKIDHIVVVMMENRSYDHVLGFRALRASEPRDEADGWTPSLVAAVNARAEASRPPPPTQPSEHFDTNPPAHPIRKSAFALNDLRYRTRLPKGVGHELADVAEQLAHRMDGPDGKRINDPSGFVNNFRTRKLRNNPYGEDLVTPFDVLRYYEADPGARDDNTHQAVDDLPIYTFLGENYGYCDRYFCSHPGPTLPNRMYSLTGDVQYDRYGFPILDNNDGDNFLLSRAQTIFDVLTKQNVSWRVYESEPSVTMLRMFARYAGDDVNIRPLAELERDVGLGDVPSVVVIEPAMHHHPEDDDHPDADMYRGQQFIRRVYAALTADPAVWGKTMLIITYDEHGGLYDHVVPPLADVLEAGQPLVHTQGSGGLSTGGSSGTPTRTGPGGVLDGSHHLPLSSDVLGVLTGERLEAGQSDVSVKVPYGLRVPTFVVSPWVPAGKGPSVTLDHCSILKTILARYCADQKPFLSDRVQASLTFNSYLTEAQPRPVPGDPLPALGDLHDTSRRSFGKESQIITDPVFRRRMREEQVDYHELSGRIARMLGR